MEGGGGEEGGYTTCEFDTGCHYTAVDMAMPTARSGMLLYNKMLFSFQIDSK